MIGRYKVIHKLGSGVFATIWLARDLEELAVSLSKSSWQTTLPKSWCLSHSSETLAPIIPASTGPVGTDGYF